LVLFLRGKKRTGFFSFFTFFPYAQISLYPIAISITLVYNSCINKRRGMKTSFKIALPIVGIAAAAALTPASVFASTYDDTTHTITADGSGFTGDSGADFIGDADTSLIISGTLQQIRDTLVAVNDYIDASGEGYAALVAKMAGLTTITLEVSGDAELTPNDLGYIQYLIGHVGNANSPTTTVNVSGDVTFGEGTDDFAGVSIADVATADFSLNTTGTITLPVGSDEGAFFGAATGNITAGGGISVATEDDDDGDDATDGVGAPETGISTRGAEDGVRGNIVIAALAGLAASTGATVVLRKGLSKKAQ
jgi:hypothetical protein